LTYVAVAATAFVVTPVSGSLYPPLFICSTSVGVALLCGNVNYRRSSYSAARLSYAYCTLHPVQGLVPECIVMKLIVVVLMIKSLRLVSLPSVVETF
jgi:hypothetical protein